MSWLTPDLIDILLSILKAVVILLVVVTCGAFMSFGERRLLGLFQNRYGPNRVGWGWFTPAGRGHDQDVL